MSDPQEKPYRPKYKGFDEERTQRAQDTAQRAREGSSARGMDANSEYMDEGPDEAARRLGTTREDVEGSVERARRKRT